MNKFIFYWLPSFVWMGFLFPMINSNLSLKSTFMFIIPIIKWFLPVANQATIATLNIFIRKFMHFSAYAILTLLLLWGFRGKNRKDWDLKWLIYAGAVAISYGVLDELLQTFISSRKGSVYDFIIDLVGAIFALGVVSLRNREQLKSNYDIHRTFSNLSSMICKIKKPLFGRSFDFTLSLIGIVISSPLWILIALLIWLEDRGPIFYSQLRVGKNGKVFKVRKFRSMIKDAEKQSGAVWASENDPRVTKVGRILRATAMDELGQLLSILKGDMSFVGPRPERPELVEQFSKEIKNYDLRHSVRPGLTGIAQIYGKYDTPPNHKLRYDILYIRNQSFWLDLKLILFSFWITFRGKWESREKKVGKQKRKLYAN